MGKEITFKQIEGTDKVNLKLSGIVLDLDLDAEVKIF